MNMQEDTERLHAEEGTRTRPRNSDINTCKQSNHIIIPKSRMFIYFLY